MNKTKKPTIKDVAALADVSVATVSRVLRKEESVREDRRTRVQQAIQQLGFTPSVAAQQMHGLGERTICVITTRSNDRAFGNPYFSDALAAIGSVVEEEDCGLQILSSNNSDYEIEKAIRLYKSGRVNGFILLSSRVYDPLVVELIRNEVPFTIIGRIIENTIADYDKIHWVNTDNIALSKQAVELFIQKGHEHIGILTGPMKYVVSQDRYTGYRQALVMNGKPFRSSYSIEAGYTYEDAKNAVEKLVTENPELTAIFATDDLKGVAAIEKLNEMGLEVPKDIAVIGCDNFDISKIIQPQLTTIHIPIQEMGVAAARMLLKLINGEKVEPPQLILDTHMVLRKSV